MEASTTLRKLTPAVLSAAAAVVLVTATTFAPTPAAAKPEYAAQTKLPCGQCHVSPGGGGPLKPFGEAFKANGYKLPGKK